MALPSIMIEPAVRAALLEDLGRAGDLTTDSIVPADAVARTVLVARQPGVVAGLGFAACAFRLIDPRIEVSVALPDGSRLREGETIATISGPARGMLTAERTALNFLCHLSGIASATRGIVDAIEGYRAQVCCTRKTMPGLRFAQKYAVRVGGGSNHRFGLDDAVLIKDNHVAIAGGVRPALERARGDRGLGAHSAGDGAGDRGQRCRSAVGRMAYAFGFGPGHRAGLDGVIGAGCRDLTCSDIFVTKTLVRRVSRA